jgi:hypothetical protein
VILLRYAESNFGGNREKPVAHFRKRSARETTDGANGTTVAWTGQAKFALLFHSGG